MMFHCVCIIVDLCCCGKDRTWPITTICCGLGSFEDCWCRVGRCLLGLSGDRSLLAHRCELLCGGDRSLVLH